ncbi:DUF1772 domain-containing protein [Aspergillus aculeatinus CBS 121060]|uniref:DUF1772-domain-containing protein n=1 Tax=Aspergillus aculeatinus CBS 121060 TaxID=1448322 RepID=A0ACD1HIH8_9EURO|nr:DUF1772-domain-containing protein [Aspergillus aculeatinus CBS 121060]RAH73277.1 DUF1772-domain-containing protein [Aspergillus aculeatinus CBS 121060]
MAASPFGYRLAHAIGLSGAAWLSGNIAALSLISVPALAETQRETSAPQGLIVKLWRKVYDKGKAQNPPVAAATATAFLYLAWSVRAGGPLFRHSQYSLTGLYTTAAILTLSIVPYTIVTMRPTNNALIRLAQTPEDLTSAGVKESSTLLNRWVFLNGIRSLLPLVGGMLGVTAALL